MSTIKLNQSAEFRMPIDLCYITEQLEPFINLPSIKISWSIFTLITNALSLLALNEDLFTRRYDASPTTFRLTLLLHCHWCELFFAQKATTKVDVLNLNPV